MCKLLYARDIECCTEAQGDVPDIGARRKPKALMVERDDGRNKGESAERSRSSVCGVSMQLNSACPYYFAIR